ncbi:TraB/GumN family protein [Thiofilum flexile]|uniref:TraB/GumN family protein n=1 Tax=Thiofilum flexile TaxID=125627 RepID=UPI00036ECDEF|nr:TraB/GumN family protein [Thiofilum flexile]
MLGCARRLLGTSWIIILCLLSMSGAVHAKRLTEIKQPMLWVIEGETPIWLFGTIHLADKRLEKLPLAVNLALRSSDAVYTEIPMEFAELLAARQAMMRTDGKVLSQVLPKPLLARLDEHLRATSAFLNVKSLGNLKTWVVSTLVATPDDSTGTALDIQLYHQAQGLNKEVGGLETAFEQIGYFDRFSEDEQIRMLEESLDAYEARDVNELMMQWYLAGNADNLVELMQQLSAPNTDQTLQQKFVQILLNERNKIMADRIDAKLKAYPNTQYFFAVGAGHLGGAESIIHFLEQKGYKLKRVGVPAVN